MQSPESLEGDLANNVVTMRKPHWPVPEIWHGRKKFRKSGLNGLPALGLSQHLWGRPNYEQIVRGKQVTLFCSE